MLAESRTSNKCLDNIRARYIDALVNSYARLLSVFVNIFAAAAAAASFLL